MKINYSFYALVILSLYIGYIDQLFIMCCSLIIHEIGHLIFIKLFKVKIKGFSLSIFGGSLNIDKTDFNKINNTKKILIYSSGVLLNLFFYLIFKDNIFGKCNIVLFVFNLLPIYPLDGYNIIKLFINDTMLNNLVIISLVILLIFAIYNNSLGLLFIILTLIYKNIIYYKEKDKIYLLNLVNNMV